ncbi:MAG: glycosyltransferase, partial [Armatimonadota bacterium]|nr:glycosyltransferase [Armatimonadota bacterium]
MSHPPLLIGIEARYLFAREKTGIENYTTQVVRALGRRADLPPVYLYTDGPPEPVDESVAEILACPRLRVRVVPRRRGWLRLWLPLAARRDGVTVMHFPGTIVPGWKPFRAVVTVHDLAALQVPHLAYGNDTRVVNTVVRRSVRRSAHVLAVSQSTARDVQRFFGVSPSRITVTYEAADPRFRPVEGARARVAERFGLRGRYLLFVGTPFRRKNLEGVMAALP